MLKYFGEEEGKAKLEEFFSIWNAFLQLFNETKAEIKAKKQRELGEKKLKEDGITIISKSSKYAIPSTQMSKFDNDDDNGRFSNIISILVQIFFFFLIKADLDSLINVIRSGNAFKDNGRKRRKPVHSTSGQHLENLYLSRERIHSEN